MNDYNKGGILTVIPKKSITVDFSKILWFKSHDQAEKIREFWHNQGYAEAEPLPFQRNQDGLVVQRNLEASGWAVAGNACREIYELPF